MIHFLLLCFFLCLTWRLSHAFRPLALDTTDDNSHEVVSNVNSQLGWLVVDFSCRHVVWRLTISWRFSAFAWRLTLINDLEGVRGKTNDSYFFSFIPGWFSSSTSSAICFSVVTTIEDLCFAGFNFEARRMRPQDGRETMDPPSFFLFFLRPDFRAGRIRF